MEGRVFAGEGGVQKEFRVDREREAKTIRAHFAGKSEMGSSYLIYAGVKLISPAIVSTLSRRTLTGSPRRTTWQPSSRISAWRSLLNW